MDTRERNKIAKKIVSEMFRLFEFEDVAAEIDEMTDEEERDFKNKMENIVKNNLHVDNNFYDRHKELYKAGDRLGKKNNQRP